MAVQLKQGPLVEWTVRKDHWVTKQAMYKVIGNARLKLNELEEILLDVEITLNNRPLSYVEDDLQLPLLTPNMMLLGQKNALLEQEVA